MATLGGCDAREICCCQMEGAGEMAQPRIVSWCPRAGGVWLLGIPGRRGESSRGFGMLRFAEVASG